MRILGVAGSPRRGGNTDVLLEACLEACLRQGVQTQRIAIADLKIHWPRRSSSTDCPLR